MCVCVVMQVMGRKTTLWARQLLDNREFVLVEGRHPSSDPNHGRDDAGYDSEEEERDLHHQDMYMNGGRNHHFGPPPTSVPRRRGERHPP